MVICQHFSAGRGRGEVWTREPVIDLFDLEVHGGSGIDGPSTIVRMVFTSILMATSLQSWPSLRKVGILSVASTAAGQITSRSTAPVRSDIGGKKEWVLCVLHHQLTVLRSYNSFSAYLVIELGRLLQAPLGLSK